MLEIKKRRKKPAAKPLWLAGLGLAIVCSSGAAAYYTAHLLIPQRSVLSQTTQRPAPPPKPTMQKLESKMMVVGDVYWGRYINDWSQKSDLKFAYPFSRLGEFHRDQYDTWINDLECPVTNNPKVSSATEDSTLKFDCSPEYLTEAKKWFDVMTLANNHTDNQDGEKGLAETRTHLDEHGIQYFGTFDPADTDDICDAISVAARVTMSGKTEKKVKLPVVWCGYHGVFKTPDAQSIAVIERYKDYFPVIAMPHSGAEYKPEPDTIKTELHHRLVDAGADVVIGDHPHWIQSSEAYRGRLIMYSLGNFIFDQQFNSEVTRSAVLTMTVSARADGNPDLARWIALGEKCSTYHDDCLEQAKTQKLQKLALDYHFSVQGSDNSGKLVKPATPAQLESIKQRLKWNGTIKGLKGNYSGE